MSSTALEIRRIDHSLERPLADFFRRLMQAGDDQNFHPHPFDDEMAQRLAYYAGKDLYYSVVDGDRVLGYGMLRGWDAGYDMPSLGIAILPEARGTGLGKLLMHFLHAAARRRGATRVRLKVHADNTVAFRLYQELGYVFRGEEAGQLVGIIDL